MQLGGVQFVKQILPALCKSTMLNQRDSTMESLSLIACLLSLVFDFLGFCIVSHCLVSLYEA
ncbi:hypothetical protein [Helicobacter sp. MIT 05-5294]|uniref:hypothetical protein n=1 Tax=Helicobacter sp. MIT 05-5294 TaxID=1548150 RepID=UPI0010FD638A|nr:hypothetical protein [Helicobacter sp. MIT 05-5294]TLD88189.1 hypothetical protein LS69_002735 [Helicobacter sp. MIT 05-5294]